MHLITYKEQMKLRFYGVDMINFEKYKNDIIDVVLSFENDSSGDRTFAVLKKETNDGKIVVNCKQCKCEDCIFYDNEDYLDECDCLDSLLKWICTDPEFIITETKNMTDET